MGLVSGGEQMDSAAPVQQVQGGNPMLWEPLGPGDFPRAVRLTCLWPKKIVRMQEQLFPGDLGGCGWDSMVPSSYCDLCDSSNGRTKRALILGEASGRREQDSLL